jgi:hypothetical protein
MVVKSQPEAHTVSVAGIGVAVGGMGVNVGGIGVAVGTGVSVGGMGVLVGVAVLTGVSVGESGVAVADASVAVGGIVGDGVAHPVRSAKVIIINARKGPSFTFPSFANRSLRSLHFKRADVTGCIG